MEPVVSIEGYKILQDTEAARRFMKEFFEKQGYRVMDSRPTPPTNASEKQVTEVKR
ncbi:MAG TPA: hypothetical protein VIM64_11020 [Puia sp.]